MLYNTIEAALALYSGFQDHSISLEAFGLDSIIEWFWVQCLSGG
jgi:hypothetical protein